MLCCCTAGSDAHGLLPLLVAPAAADPPPPAAAAGGSSGDAAPWSVLQQWQAAATAYGLQGLQGAASGMAVNDPYLNSALTLTLAAAALSGASQGGPPSMHAWKIAWLLPTPCHLSIHPCMTCWYELTPITANTPMLMRMHACACIVACSATRHYVSCVCPLTARPATCTCRQEPERTAA